MIRKLQKDEFRQATDLALEVFMQTGKDDFNDDGLETFKSFVQNEDLMNELVIYGAFEADELAGILGTKQMGTHISLFFIREDYRRKGIGRKLFDFAILDNTVSQMTVNSSTYAVDIYRSFGFKQSDELQETNGLKYIPMKRITE